MFKFTQPLTGAVSIFFKVSLYVVLIGDNQNDKLKKENPDLRFYSLYPHVPLWRVCKNFEQYVKGQNNFEIKYVF